MTAHLFGTGALLVVTALVATCEAQRWDFESVSLETVPPGWIIEKTRDAPGSEWRVEVAGRDGQRSRVLAQVSSAGPKPQFNLCVYEAVRLADLDLSVSVKARGGVIDRGGGLVWRYQDARNYYVCRWNPLEDNFRVYRVLDGVRSQMDHARVKASRDGWHRIRIVQVGRELECWLDGERFLEAEDDTFSNAGRIGLWTKADAVTLFDDLEVRPAERLPESGR
jgi:hypothetical protein